MTSRQTNRRSLRLAILLLSGSALAGVPLVGAVYAAETWTGTASSDWFTAGNWDGNAIPTASEVATIDTVATNPAVIDTAAATASALVVAGSSGTTGTLTISNGGSLTAGTAVLAQNGATSNATVTLQGGSTMTLTDSLSTFEIGEQGVAHLNVFSGSTLNTNGTVVGDAHGSFGYVEVSGTGSVWNNAALQIGNTGTGSVTVENGGVLNAGAVLVGAGSGDGGMGVTDATTLVTASELVIAAGSGTGTVTVENGAVVHVTLDTVVGGPVPGNPASSGGIGTLNIFAGGAVHSDGNASVGDSANTQGNVTVDGTNSQWTVGAALYVGKTGTGSVTVSNAGLLSAGSQLVLGLDAGSTGTLTVNSGATLTDAGSLTVGSSGNGTMNVQSGATVTAAITDVGFGLGSSGSLLIDGTNSHMTVDQLTLGTNGFGTMTISGGGLLTGQGDGFVGYHGDTTIPTSTATVTGTGSEWDLGSNNLTLAFSSGSAGSLTVSSGGAVNMNNLTIGASGTGSVTVSTGGTLSADTVVLGQNALSTGTLTLNSGATFDAGSLSIGSSGTGTLNVQSGATVIASDTTVGLSPGSTGSLLIDGTNSHMTVDLFTMGESGVGTMTISGGGLLVGLNDAFVGYYGDSTIPTSSATVTGTGSGWSIGAHTLAIGVSTGSSGSLTVSNGGAVNMEDLTIGAGGAGTLAISSAGTVNAGGGVSIGKMAGATGTVTVDGPGSSLASTTDLDVGDGGTGSLTITNGGAVYAANGIFLGEDLHGSGTVSVDGANSVLNAGSVITVGNSGAGSLSVTNGGYVSTPDLYIAGENTSTASVTVDAASMFLADGLFVGEHGNGTLTIRNGGEVITSLAVIGDVAGSTGVVALNDAGLVGGPGDTMTIGNFGTGTVTVQNTGGVDFTDIYVGEEQGGVGTLSLSNNAQAFADTLLVGGDDADPTSGGTGTVNIGSGSTVSLADVGLGMGAASNGTVIVDGANSTFAVTDSISIGEFGTGAFTVQNGGVATVANETYIGHQEGSIGTLVVDGAGSQFISTNHIFVGGDPLNASGGTGTVSVTNGGAISTADSIYLGISPDSTGTMTIDGAGSTASSAGFFVGYGGTGNATVQNGGVVTAGILVDIASIPNSTGTLIIDGAGSSVSAPTSAVGDFGNGTLLVRNGGTFTGGLAYIGYDAAGGFTGVGTATVDGAGSSLVSQSLDVGFYGHGQLILSNGGVASTPILTVATQAGSVGEIDIGAAPGTAAAAPGTLDTPTVTFGAGSGSLNFNHTDSAYTFAPAIVGAGTINQIAGATFLAADDSGFTGATNITGGALHVNGSLTNSAVAVSGSGTLNGNGTVGAVTAASGGIVAPGNSIGTLTVSGDYSAASGSVYQAQLDSAGHADLLKVTGTATLANGASLNITKTDAGGYAPGTYTLLTAAGGVNGTYTVTGDLIQSSAFGSQTVSYDAHDIYLNVTKTATFTSAGATPNQKAVGGGADSLPTTSPLYGALISLPTFAVAQGAFDQLSGEIHASAKTAELEDSRLPREAALGRLSMAFAAGNTGSEHPAPWGQVYGSWGSTDANGNAAALGRSSRGFLGGFDLPVYEMWRVGILGGYSRGSFNVKDRSSFGTSDSYHLGGYAGLQDGALGVRFGMVYSWHDLTTGRTVNFAGFNNALASEYNAGTTQGFGEVGYHVPVAKIDLEPFANLAYVSLHTDGFSETGGTAALTAVGNTEDAVFTTLGLRGKYDITLGNTLIGTHGTVGWRHAFGDLTPNTAMSFTGSHAFTIQGVPLAQDGAAFGAGFDLSVARNVLLGISYDGQYAASAHDDTIKLNIDWKL